jgi:ribulose-phosphate 3-epimerase
MALIAPSIITADFAHLREAMEVIRAAGATVVHVDVRDGHFVPGISVGQPVIARLRKATDLVLDVHLMIERPERYAPQFLDLGVDRLTVHAEATVHLARLISHIRGHGACAGVALNPSTPLNSLSEWLGEIDSLTLLTADPSDENEGFLPRAVEKVHGACDERARRGLDFALQVEGGVGLENWEVLARAGADILVLGSVIFESENPQARLGDMIRRAAGVRASARV